MRMINRLEAVLLLLLLVLLLAACLEQYRSTAYSMPCQSGGRAVCNRPAGWLRLSRGGVVTPLALNQARLGSSNQPCGCRLVRLHSFEGTYPLGTPALRLHQCMAS